jgi:hypothetical protein
MMTDTVLRRTVMQHLIENFGNVEAERFISLVIREPFDYTEWQRTLFEHQSVDDIFDDLEKMEAAQE